MGTNNTIDFYILTVDESKANFMNYRCNDGGWLPVPLYLAYKKDNDENGVMIDLFTGIEIYPKANHPLPTLTYVDKKIASLIDLEKASVVINFYKKGEKGPLIEYTKILNKRLEDSQKIFDEYCSYYENITDYIYEIQPNL